MRGCVIFNIDRAVENLYFLLPSLGCNSASLAAKGKDTLDQLEDTRAELRRVQGSWSTEQLEWRREREEVRPAFFSVGS